MDFKANIEELIKQGYSFNDIAEQFDNALNAAMVAESEENLDSIYEEALDAIDAALEDDNMFTKDTVVNAALCWAIEKHDDWGKDEIDLVKSLIEATLEIIEDGIASLKPLLEQERKKKNRGHECKCTDEDALRKFLENL